MRQTVLQSISSWHPMAAAKPWLTRYERPLSFAAWIGGFAFDNYAFHRVDHPATQAVLAAYVVIAATTIAMLHYMESKPGQRLVPIRLRALLPIVTQFAFGGLWSAFLIFYGRSAMLPASWPFLLMLFAMFIGNELLRQYHERLTFSGVLLFFALMSYTVFVVPVFSKTIGEQTFVISGLLAVLVFTGFLAILRRIGAERFDRALSRVALGAGAVFLIMNALYFTSVLPPLPLTLKQAGVYNSVKKVGEHYEAVGQPQPWYASLGYDSDIHIRPGERLFLYSAVFAPVDLKTDVIHVWQRLDEKTDRWVTESTVPLTITGGREGGYRLYSIKNNPGAGRWRVDIDTVDGRLIGRVGFVVAMTQTPPARALQIFN